MSSLSLFRRSSEAKLAKYRARLYEAPLMRNESHAPVVAHHIRSVLNNAARAKMSDHHRALLHAEANHLYLRRHAHMRNRRARTAHDAHAANRLVRNAAAQVARNRAHRQRLNAEHADMMRRFHALKYGQ